MFFEDEELIMNRGETRATLRAKIAKYRRQLQLLSDLQLARSKLARPTHHRQLRERAGAVR
jgi:hypothetical protein